MSTHSRAAGVEPRSRAVAAGDTARRAADGTRSHEIIEAAVRCFERWGISRTRVDDIAAEAGMARSQVYKYFSGKDAITLAVIMESIRQHNAALRRQIPLSGPSDQVIVDSMVAIIRHAIENRYTAALLSEPDSPHFTSRALATKPEVLALLGDYWSAVFDYARSRGELRAHFDPESATRWVIFILLSYLALPEMTRENDDELIKDIRTYCLPGLLVDPSIE
ncbi:TetR/AcrR family transcriptional regulator [Mycolicibacterium thermoresistibile]